MNTLSQISVVPRPYEDPKLICKFTYTVCDFKLSDYITFNVILLDANSIPIIVKQVSLTGQAYAAWGNDDQYIINYICMVLNLVQEVPAVVVEEPVVEEPVVEEPVAVVVEEPVVEEPVIEEPVIEEPVVEEPVVEEPVAVFVEEPVAEEPAAVVVEEPAA